MADQVKPDWYQHEVAGQPHEIVNLPYGKFDATTTKKVGETDWPQLLKDFIVDGASQLPLMAIEGGGFGKSIVRAGASIASGTLADQLFNNRPVTDSLAEAGANTGISMLLPGKLENETHFLNPSVQGTGVSAPFMKILNLFSPSNWSNNPRMMLRPGATQAVPANMGNLMKDFITNNRTIPMGIRQSVASVPAESLDYVLKNGFGLTANGIFDSTINRPQKQQK